MSAELLGSLLPLATTLGAAWLLTYAVHSTLLIGSVWLADRMGLLRSLRLRDLAWRTALVGALFTTTLQLAAGLTPFGGAAELPASVPAPALAASASELAARTRAETPPVAIVARTLRVHGPADGTRVLFVTTPVPSLPASAPVPGTPPQFITPAGSEQPRSVAVPRLSPVGFAALGWAVVASALLLRLGVLRARLLSALGERAPVLDPMVRARLEGLCREVGHGRQVRLTTAAGLRSPVALGWSEICLPAEALLELDDAQQRSVLAHELAHLRRLDPLWLALGTVLEQLFFFQPLNRVARARMQEVAEFLCDDWAAARNGSGLDVARGLASVAGWLDGRASTLPLAGMAEHPSQLLTRVTRLLERGADEVERLRPWHLGGMVFLLLMTVLVAPVVRASPERRASAPPERDDASMPRARTLPDAERDVGSVRAAETQPGPATAGHPVRRLPAASPEPPTRLLALAAAPPAPAAPAAPAARPAPPAPPAPPPPVDGERIRRDAQRMARDAQRQAHDALRRAHARSSGHGGRRGDRTPADPKTVDALVAALKDTDPGVRQVAAESLGCIGDARAIDPVASLLGDSAVQVRKSAVEALGKMEDARAIPALGRAAGDANPEVRREAAEALLSFDEPAASEPLLKLLGDPDSRVRLIALEGLSQRGDRRALGPLSKLVKDPTVEVRARAVRALGRYRDPAAQEGLIAALKDENAEVREAAADGLGELELKAAPQALLDATRDSSPEVRHQAAQALGQIHDGKAVPQLRALLDDADSDVREAAVEALSEIRDGAALQALIAAMQSKDVTIRRAAAQALGQRD